MVRGALAILLLAVIGVITLPFIVSNLYIDQRGVTIPGHVYFKRETVSLRDSTMTRTPEVTIEYSKPDGTGVTFFDVPMTDAEYDSMHVSQPVSLHYLRPEDLPDLPLVKSLRRAQLLPTVHLANKTTFSTLQFLWTPRAGIVTEVIAGMAVLLLLWRIAHVPGFTWAVAACILSGVIALIIADFPRPMPAPAAQVRRATGQVKSIQRITRLFDGRRSRGIDAEQPIQVVGVEFVPEGRTEAVLAVDLIDAKSVPGLHEKGSVGLTYESASPRTAYVDGATRNFVSRNIRGMGMQGVAVVLVGVVFFAVWWAFSRGYRRLTRRAAS